jgi:hypothetical protein
MISTAVLQFRIGRIFENSFSISKLFGEEVLLQQAKRELLKILTVKKGFSSSRGAAYGRN